MTGFQNQGNKSKCTSAISIKHKAARLPGGRWGRGMSVTTWRLSEAGCPGGHQSKPPGGTGTPAQSRAGSARTHPSPAPLQHASLTGVCRR